MANGGGEAAVVAELLGEVERLTAVDGREADAIATLLAELPSMARPFDEGRGPTHVTASAIVVHPGGTLLHRHRRLGLWLQPGGHIEPGEHPRQAALRECREETGVAGYLPEGHEGVFHVDVHPGPRGHTHLDLRYLVACERPSLGPGPDESQEVALLSFAEARELADPGLRAALGRAEVAASALWQGGGDA